MINRINEFTFEYVDKNRESLQVWTLDNFINDFDTDEKILDLYLDRIEVKPLDGVGYNHPISDKDIRLIKSSLKASFAQDLFDENGFYEVIQQNDNMIEKVLELESTN